MSESNANEVWQVDVNGTIYEAPFYELGEWIGGGSLLPGDKVRRGNLRWIEAGRVPTLLPFFNAKEKGLPMPVVVTTTDAQAEAAAEPAVVVEESSEPVTHAMADQVDRTPAHTPFNPDECAIHGGIPSVFLCDGCANGYCKACPKSYGGTVKICPLCGAMCRPVAEVKAAHKQAATYSHAINEGFGFGDFGNALGHPFKFKTSLVFGAILYAMFTVGQSASGIGGIYMFVGALFCVMLANMLTFGVLSHTVDNFVQGKLDANFMPDFENFEIWDDVVHPFFLWIAATVASFGPFLVTAAIGFYLVLSAISDQAEAYKADLEKIPGTHIYNGRELVDQSGDVKDVLARIDKEKADRIAAMSEEYDDGPAANTAPTPFVDHESREQEELWAAATESRKKSLESAIGKTPETQAQEQAQMISAFLRLAAPLVVIGFITFLWGAFLFPATCAVAGYTKSFMATINPLVALDTIKRLGGSYVLILLMALLLLIMSGIVGFFFALIFFPFNLPGIGNIPAKGLSAMFTFYVSVVFSCTIGYALFKKADKLGLHR